MNINGGPYIFSHTDIQYMDTHTWIQVKNVYPFLDPRLFQMFSLQIS